MVDLNSIQFHHHQPGESVHQITATNQHNEVVGWMAWAAKNTKFGRAGEITALRVRPDLRRQGIATEMFGRSQNFEVGARHSGSRTPEGTAFAKSTGTRVPKLKKPLPSESTSGYSDESLMQMGDLDRRAKRLD